MSEVSPNFLDALTQTKARMGEGMNPIGGSGGGGGLNPSTGQMVEGASALFTSLNIFHQSRVKARQMEIDAQLEGMKGTLEYANATKQHAAITQVTARMASSAFNNFANSGIEVGGGGTVQAVNDTITRVGSTAASDALLVGHVARLTRRMNQRNLLIAAKNEKHMGIINSIFSFATSMTKAFMPV